jgi:hypothetical protein
MDNKVKKGLKTSKTSNYMPKSKSKLKMGGNMKNIGFTVTLAVLTLLLGGLFTYVAMPRTVEVPVDRIVRQNVSVIVPVEVEVVKEVAVDYLGMALAEFLDEVEEDLDKYQELSRVEVADDYTVAFDVDRKDNKVIVVSFEVSYRLIDTLTNERENVVKNVEVKFVEGKDPKVSY